MFCFFKVDLNAMFVNSTPASIWTMVGFRPLSSHTFRNAFNTVGPFLSFSEMANPIFENTYLILNINVSPSLNYFKLLVSHRSICHKSSILNKIVLSLANEPQSPLSTLLFHFHPGCMSVSVNEHIKRSYPLGAVSLFFFDVSMDNSSLTSESGAFTQSY